MIGIADPFETLSLKTGFGMFVMSPDCFPCCLIHLNRVVPPSLVSESGFGTIIHIKTQSIGKVQMLKSKFLYVKLLSMPPEYCGRGEPAALPSVARDIAGAADPSSLYVHLFAFRDCIKTSSPCLVNKYSSPCGRINTTSFVRPKYYQSVIQQESCSLIPA